MKSSAWMLPCSFVLFENSQRFLRENKIKPVGRKSVRPSTWKQLSYNKVQLFPLSYLSR